MTDPAPLDGSVDDWLAWQLTLHASEMELGLERVGAVADALGVRQPRARSVVVAGTNGKGSCVALLESLLSDSYRVGAYTSPHLWRYNERFRIQGAPVSDAALCRAFRAVEAARGEISLTFFEYGTLAALWLFAEAALDVVLLEVGLGGRLDAVNIVDADVALITQIGLDHMDWLGPDREAIGREKAGVMRSDRPAICADRDRPGSIDEHAGAVGASLVCIGGDFDIEVEDARWRYRNGAYAQSYPRVDGVLADNLAAALATSHALTGAHPEAVRVDAACRAQAGLAGRRERIDGDVAIIYDVGHNAEAVAMLIADLQSWPCAGETHVVLGMLGDKPVEAVVPALAPHTDRFYFAGLNALNKRGLDAQTLARRGAFAGGCFADPAAALAAARERTRTGDRIVVCGSFLTVAHARKA